MRKPENHISETALVKIVGSIGFTKATAKQVLEVFLQLHL
jgi:hypothetical protein